MKMDTLLKAEELAGFRRVSWRKIAIALIDRNGQLSMSVNACGC
jgi:hypothetical protein